MCRFIVPLLGILHTISGSILKATTTNRSALKLLRSVINLLSFSFNGCNTGILFKIPAFFTAHSFNSFPLPFLLSGAATIATTLYPLSIRCCRLFAAKSGVPKNIMLMLQVIFFSFYFLSNLLILSLLHKRSRILINSCVF